jgi:uncharacterized protein
LADWWRGLTTLENLGRYLWVYIQPWGKKLMPVTNAPRALLLGGLWGWLPCGLVYAALASALTQPSPLQASSAMLAFGLGTLPAVLAAGVMAQSLARALQRRPIRLFLAVIVMALGLWVISAAVIHASHAGHNHIAVNPQSHEHSHQSSQPSSASHRTDETQQIPDNNNGKNESSTDTVTGEHHHHH